MDLFLQPFSILTSGHGARLEKMRFCSRTSAQNTLQIEEENSERTHENECERQLNSQKSRLSTKILEYSTFDFFETVVFELAHTSPFSTFFYCKLLHFTSFHRRNLNPFWLESLLRASLLSNLNATAPSFNLLQVHFSYAPFV